MATVSQITPARLRNLAEAKAPTGKVLSVFINLDPSEFGTRPARATEINAVLDEAARMTRDESLSVSHQEREALKGDVERIREHLQRKLDASDARALAIFSSEPAGLFEVIKLPRPVDHRVAIGDRPDVEPLTRIGTSETWWVALVSRRTGRLLAGGAEGLVEIGNIQDDVHGWHDQGGWSQSRYQRGVAKEVRDHLRNVAADLHDRLRNNGHIDGLLVGGPVETLTMFEEVLHPDVRKYLAGHVEVDVDNASPDEVLAAAQPTLLEHHARRDEELIERLQARLATDDRIATGLADTLRAVHERRVDALLVQQAFQAAGVRCQRCGWLGVTAGSACPADGTATQVLDSIVPEAINATIAQDGDVRVLRHEVLRDAGGIAALLRF